MLALAVAVSASTCSTHQSTPVSGYVTRPPDGTILFVYPKVLAIGRSVVVQTRLPRTLGATQCVSLIDPAGIEADVSCGVVEARRVVWEPTTAGKHVVRLELFIGGRLGARREEAICVVGGLESADCQEAP